MLQHSTIPLTDRLKRCAALWCKATGRSPGALSTIVVNHGSFFSRLESPAASPTTATLEKFARFFEDSDNWADQPLPEEVRDFIHVVGITAPQHDPSTGKSDEISGGEAAA